MPWLPSVVWLGLLILFALVEAATVGLISIWFAAGALVALLSTFFTDSVWTVSYTHLDVYKRQA